MGSRGYLGVSGNDTCEVFILPREKRRGQVHPGALREYEPDCSAPGLASNGPGSAKVSVALCFQSRYAFRCAALSVALSRWHSVALDAKGQTPRPKSRGAGLLLLMPLLLLLLLLLPLLLLPLLPILQRS